MIDFEQPIDVQLRMRLIERVQKIVGRERFNYTARRTGGNVMKALIKDSNPWQQWRLLSVWKYFHRLNTKLLNGIRDKDLDRETAHLKKRKMLFMEKAREEQQHLKVLQFIQQEEKQQEERRKQLEEELMVDELALDEFMKEEHERAQKEEDERARKEKKLDVEIDEMVQLMDEKEIAKLLTEHTVEDTRKPPSQEMIDKVLEFDAGYMDF